MTLALGSRTRQVLALLGVVLVVVLVWLGSGDGTPSASPAPTGSAQVSATGTAVDQLPREARRTIALIEAGGPFPYRQDGATFGNRERLLPAQPAGYYREYTVPTPGSRDRGARRLVLGDSGELYYTADHYRSFTRIDHDTRE